MLNIKSTCEILGISRFLLARFVKDGEIPHYKYGEMIKFDEDAVKRWKEKHIKASASPVVEKDEVSAAEIAKHYPRGIEVGDA